MLYVRVERNTEGRAIVAHVVDAERRKMLPNDYCENRNDWKTYADAQAVAAALGAGYIATDAGSHVSPRYDVQTLPKVGDDVSYAFNGDSYPCGKIVSISAGPVFRKIVTEETTNNGTVHKNTFWRRRLSGSWVMNRTWSLVAGHVSKTNPEF